MNRHHPARIVAVLAAFALVLGACEALSYLPGTPRPSWCDPTDTAVNDGHTAAFDAVYTELKGPLSQTDCQEVVAHLNAARDFAAQYPTVADVKAAGWVEAVVYSPGQGVHFVDPSRMTGPFDPELPNWLMYDGTGPNAQITGMMFLEESGALPPEGFAGANDHWHNHHPLCVDADANPFIVGEDLTDAQCASLGGVNMDMSSRWMVHVWLPIYDDWDATDIFNKNHPSL